VKLDRRSAAPGLAWAGILALGACSVTGAVEPRVFTETRTSLLRGDATGVAVTERGRLFLAPALVRLSEESWSEAPAHVWAVARAGSGSLYLGTGPEGRVYKLGPSGRLSLVFATKEPMVTALAVLAGGDLVAGTSPEGKIYRIRADGTGALWTETGTRYVWALATEGERVYAGTGEEGLVLEIDPRGEVSTFFDADEAHVVCLVPLPDGGLLAGGAGRGLVYQLDREGHGTVLHDDELPEVRAVARHSDGSVVAALLAPPEPDPHRPLLRIQLPDGGPALGGDGVRDLEEERGPTLEGSIEGLPMPRERRRAGPRGRIVQIGPSGVVTELWRSAEEAPFALSLDGAGRTVFGTGEPARLYRVEPDGDVALLATLREGQVTGLGRLDRAVVLATSNPAALYRLEGETEGPGGFVSRPIDSGGPARWGGIRWLEEGPPGLVELYTRTGSSAAPDATWSAWSPALTAPAGSPIVNPEGRFLQWRARLVGRGEREGSVSSVQVSYSLHNRAPEIREFRLDAPRDAVSGPALFRFETADPDGDPVVVRVRYRQPGGRDWIEAGRSEPIPAHAEEPAAWSEGMVSWDTAAVAEGTYEVEAVASDQSANAPGEGAERVAVDRLRLTVDRTPPRLVLGQGPGGSVEVVVADGESTVRRLGLVREERTWFSARPLDGVCDSPRERFVLDRDVLAGEGWRLRAEDAAGNAVEEPLVPGDRLD
jgi:hypothetical protein